MPTLPPNSPEPIAETKTASSTFENVRRSLSQLLAVLHPSRLKHNWLPKLLSLVVAYSFWYVTTEERRTNVEKGFDIPITVQDSTGGKVRRAVDNLRPSSVRVILKGKPQRLKNLQAKSIEAVVDVTNVPEGSFTREVTVIPPADTTVLRMTPSKAQGFVDTELSRVLPVTASLTAMGGKTLFRTITTPSSVNVNGPRRSVQTIRKIVTSPVALEAGREIEVPLLAIDEQGQAVAGIKIRPSSVTLRRIDRGELPIKSLKVVLLDPPSNLVVKSEIYPLEVRVLGPANVLADMQEVVGRVDYRPGNYSETVRLKLPRDTYALDTITAELAVRQKAVPSELQSIQDQGSQQASELQPSQPTPAPTQPSQP